VGGDFNLKHKATGSSWGAATIPMHSQNARKGH
jgi:hypothetical protein